MSLSFAFVQTKNLVFPPDLESSLAELALVRVLDCSEGLQTLWDFMQSPEAVELRCLALSSELLEDKQFLAYLETEPRINRAVWVYSEETSLLRLLPTVTQVEKQKIFSSIPLAALSSPRIFQALLAALDPQRPMGVKSFLQEGAAIYTQSLIGWNQLGANLDPLNQLTSAMADATRSACIWSGVNAIVAEAISNLGNDLAQGARVEVQAGTDSEKLSISIRFPAQPSLAKITSRFFNRAGTNLSSWPLLRESADFVDGRFYAELNQVEVTAVWFRSPEPAATLKPVIVRAISQVPMDDPAKTASYKFLSFSSIALGKKRGLKFRKQATTALAEQAAATEDTAAAANDAAGLSDPNNSMLVAGQDPTQDGKRNLLASLVDRQKEALAQNVQRLETELAEAAKREKELMGMVDRAIQQKDKLQRDLKALELRLESATSPNNSLVVKLQKQLDEANRQKKLLSKRLAELVQTKKSA